MKYKITSLIIFTTILSYSQSTWHFTAGTAFGFITKDIKIWKHSVTNKHSYGLYAGAGYEYSFTDHISARAKIQFHQYYSKVFVNNIEVSGYNYNFELPIDVRYTFYKTWTVGAGVSFQDYRERSEFELDRSNNIRTNLIINGSYQFKNNWTVDLGYSYMISEFIESFVVLHYTHHIYLGVTFLLGHRTKQNLNNN